MSRISSFFDWAFLVGNCR